MRFTRIAGWLGAAAIGAGLACSSAGRTDYFTFRLDDFPLVSGTDTTFVTAYIYVPWSAEPLESTGEPCWLVGFDLQGHAIREIAGNRVTDDADQEAPFPGTYVQYLGDENGDLLPQSCVPIMDGRFRLGDEFFRVGGNVVRAFPAPEDLAITPGDGSYLGSESAWYADEDPAVFGALAFWPYEYGSVSSSALRFYPTESGGR